MQIRILQIRGWGWDAWGWGWGWEELVMPLRLGLDHTSSKTLVNFYLFLVSS